MYGHNGAYGAYGGYAAAPPPMHGAPPPPAPGYQPPPPQPGYGAAPPGYGAPAPAYSVPPPGPPGYGSPPPSYGYGAPPPPGYSGYGAPPPPGPPPRPPDGPTVGYGPPASSRPPNRRSQDSGTGEKGRKNQRSGKASSKGNKSGNDKDNVKQVQKKQKVEQHTQQKKNNSDAPNRKQKNKKNNEPVANEQKQLADAPTPHSSVKEKSSESGKGSVKGVPVSANIFVHGIPLGWNDDALKDNFKKFGTIVSAAVARKPDGASKGYGFVGYDLASSANAAIASLDGATVEERQLTVKLKDGGGGGDTDGKAPVSAKGKASRAAPGTTAYIYQIPREWSEAELERHFTHCGTIASVKLGRAPDGTTRGFGFIDFANGPVGVLKAMIGMDNFNAGPRSRLQVNPKQGEEELVPPIPDLEFPPPANPFDGPTRGWSEPGSTIFVFYLPREWTEWELFLCFVHLGEIVNCKIQTKDNESGQKESRGFGFVSFRNKLSAVRAVKAMNGFDTGYKMRLQVSIKKGEEEHLEPALNAMKIIPDFVHVGKAAGKGGAGKAEQSSTGDLKKVPPDANVFVHHLPSNWTEEDLRKTFETHGNILALKIAKDDDGVSKGFGFVGYESAASAKDAISNLDGYKLDGGRNLIVKLKDDGRAKPY